MLINAQLQNKRIYILFKLLFLRKKIIFKKNDLDMEIRNANKVWILNVMCKSESEKEGSYKFYLYWYYIFA